MNGPVYERIMRAIDVLIAATAAVVTAPLLAVIALAGRRSGAADTPPDRAPAPTTP